MSGLHPGGAARPAGRPRASAGAAGRSPRPGPGDTLLYLYGVVEAGDEAERLLEARRLPGLHPGAPVFGLAAGDLIAAVSDVPAAVFDEAPLNALLADLPRLTPFAVRHEEVVRALLPAASALVPMTFGAVYRDAEGVRALLRERAADLRERLARVRGRQEWGFRVYRDAARWLETVDLTSPALRRLAAEMSAATPGRAYLLRKQAERERAAEADLLAARALDAMLARLSAVSAAGQRDPAPTGREGTIPVALTAAFLVDVAASETFCAVAADLAREYTPRGLRPEITGPWAPYSFVRGRGGTG